MPKHPKKIRKTDVNEDAFNRRHRLELLKAQLERERASFQYQWRDINDFVRPRRGRFFVNDSNKGDRRNLKIIDSTATFASKNLAAGMMSGVSSPSRPWFKMGAFDPADDARDDGKEWFHINTSRMKSVLIRSNLYSILPILYGDMGDFGTGCMYMDEDVESIVRFYSFPIGSYMISSNASGKIDTFVREFQMTVRQVVEMFARNPENPNEYDWTNVSTQVKSMWDNNHKENWIIVVHAVIPNENYKEEALESRFKKYVSIYYERGNSGSSNNTGSGYAAQQIKS